MGCPSNVRLYTSYYNKFIMADLLNALSFSHGMTLVVHAVSFGYAYHFMDKVPDSEHYTLTEIGADGAVPVTDGLFKNMNPMTLILIMNSIVGVTMLVHLGRRLSGQLSNIYGSMWIQLLHILAYGISHFIAILLVALVAGFRDILSVTIIFTSALCVEALQHLSANPAKPDLGSLDNMSRGLVGLFAGLPTLVAIILIGIALDKQDLDYSGLAFASLIVLEGMKFLTEAANYLFSAIPVLDDLFKEAFDTRVAHSVYDALLKVFIVWFILLEKLEKSGGIDGETDLSSSGSTVIGWVGLAIFIIYLVYSFAARPLGLPKLSAPGISREEFPSGTMEEKSRMLQVA